MEKLINERIDKLQYLIKIHKGNAYWMSILRLDPTTIKNFYHPNDLQKRSEQFFFLGLSLGALLSLEGGPSFSNAVTQCLDEFSYHYSSIANQGFKLLKKFTSGSQSTIHGGDASGKLKKRSKSSISPNTLLPKDSNQAFEPSNHSDLMTSTEPTLDPLMHPRIQNELYLYREQPKHRIGSIQASHYVYFQTPSVPCQLDYCQVFISLCDVLILCYTKMLDSSNEDLVNIDQALQSSVFEPVSDDLTTIATTLSKTQLHSLVTILNSYQAQASPIIDNNYTN